MFINCHSQIKKHEYINFSFFDLGDLDNKPNTAFPLETTFTQLFFDFPFLWTVYLVFNKLLRNIAFSLELYKIEVTRGIRLI